MPEEEGEYFINFDTQINPGKLEATRIRIDNVTITDLEKKLNIALVEHPLYPDLEKYVLANRKR